MRRLTSISGFILLALAMSGVSVARAQTLNATTNTGWTTWTFGSGSMVDFLGDQQTGQGADDFVGDNGIFTMASQAGTTSFAPTTDYLFFRARMEEYSADDKWGNGGNWGIGMDLDGDGDMDMIVMMSESAGNVNNRTRTVTFGTRGTGANTGPSTTTWSFASQTAITLTLNQTYDLQSATAVDGQSYGGDADAWLTFGLSFAQLQTAIRTYADNDANPATTSPFASYTLTYDSRIAMISFTSTQNNALNQDLAGVNGGTSSTLTFSALGAITPQMGPGGYVPEPATYAQIGVLLSVAGFIVYRRRKKSGMAPTRAS
ncbi:MAG: hypothetical protein RIS54_1936 [Verrucomicrobiota bacterium]|jgi:hypothetical protein